MDDKKDADNKPKKKSVIASLDLKNYKAKYTDIYGNGKPQEAELDNFLIAEPEKETAKPKILPDKKHMSETKPNIQSKVNINNQKNENKTDIVKVNPIPEIDNKSIVESKFAINKVDKQVDSDFERRVFKEAENDFYDEKPVKNTTFRSNIIPNRNDDDATETSDFYSSKLKKLNVRTPVTVNVRTEINPRERSNTTNDIADDTEERKSPRHTESYGMAISAIALVYSIATFDKGLFFLSLSLLSYLARPIIAAPFGKYANIVKNLLKGFSIALFFGAIFFVFF